MRVLIAGKESDDGVSSIEPLMIMIISFMRDLL